MVNFFGLSRALFIPLGTSYEACGGLQSFNRKTIPTRRLHTNCLQNPVQLQHPSIHFSSSVGIQTAQTFNDILLN